MHINRIHDIGPRIKRIVDVKADGNIKQFAYLVTYSAEHIQDVVDGVALPSIDLVISVCFMFPDINPQYILTGNGRFRSPRVLRSLEVTVQECSASLSRCAGLLDCLNDDELEDLRTTLEFLNEVTLARKRIADWESRQITS